MHKGSLRLFDLLALLLLLAYGWSVRHTRAGAADPTWTQVRETGMLRVGSDAGFRPFTEQQNGHWSGYDVDLVQEIARRLALAVEWRAVSYDALYDTLGSGEVDLLASALPLAPEQGWRARFSQAYLDGGLVLVTHRDSGIRAEGDLNGRAVGAALGSDGDTLLRNLHRQDASIEARSSYDAPQDALAALERGDLDAVITDSISALGLTESNGEFVIARGLTFEPYVLALPVGAYQLQSEIDRVLTQLRAEGYFERLNARWFGNGEPGTSPSPSQ
jgi:ABC-type amino acid transport substrate-binding protein